MELIYKPNRELMVIVPYFNPCGYITRLKNYEVFINLLEKSAIDYLVIECVFNQNSHTLPPSKKIIRVKSNSLLWQKERLINLGIKSLSPECKYVAWIDSDVVFSNLNWANEACHMLSREYTIVQLWEKCYQLPKESPTKPNHNVVTSFASIIQKDRNRIFTNLFENHGHTGYGWAIRREIIESVRLYEHAIAGSADHYMGHAIVNHFGPCVFKTMLNNSAQINHLLEWGESFYSSVDGKIGCVKGEIFHMWHGELKNRKYDERLIEISNLGYDPYTDIIANENHPLEWTDYACKHKPELISYLSNYFISRSEDHEFCQSINNYIPNN